MNQYSKVSLMRKSFLSILCSFLLVPSASEAINDYSALNLEEWIAVQTPLAIKKLHANISPADGAQGSVLASPQRQNPDYYSHWVRDGALVMDTVFQLFLKAQKKAEQQMWEKELRSYIYFSRGNQLASTLTNLGEPKFFVDGTPFSGPWGRPQNDGPALRAITLIQFANFLLDQKENSELNHQFVRTWLYNAELPAGTVIKADLEYVSHHWREASFDLWEENKADHFYTQMVQRKSLLMGAELAERLQDPFAAQWYLKQVIELDSKIFDHWDFSEKFIRVSLNRVEGVEYKNSGLDIATILATLHGSVEDGFFSPNDDKVMATFEKLEKVFSEIYPINRQTVVATLKGSEVMATALGRYPEDKYSGADFESGNPWVLSTAAGAEFLYRKALALTQKQSAKSSSAKMKSQDLATIEKLVRRGDQFLSRLKYHANADGSMSEQLDRNTGYMISARDLTWSYASFLTAVWSREKVKIEFNKIKNLK